MSGRVLPLCIAVIVRIQVGIVRILVGVHREEACMDYFSRDSHSSYKLRCSPLGM